MNFLPLTRSNPLPSFLGPQLCVLVLLFTSSAAFSQSVSKASAASAQNSYPVQLYKQATQQESHLFNGAEYVDYRKQNRDGHQFFLQDEQTPGRLHYDGAVYEEVPLLYDLVTGEVLTVVRGFLLQKLVPEKISSFEVHGHSFVRVVASDSAEQTALPTGFYDVLHQGETQLLAQRLKVKEYLIVDNKELEKYKSEDKYFIKKKDSYTQVRTSQSVYKVFADKKKELKKFARTQKLNFRKQREAAILALVTQYEALLPR